MLPEESKWCSLSYLKRGSGLSECTRKARELMDEEEWQDSSERLPLNQGALSLILSVIVRKIHTMREVWLKEKKKSGCKTGDRK